ncbi:D-alanyl-D-alanine carboxypeptidase family protein [Robiginitomaculum antarcticum]|uniref:D-alanyl-D-alanine carboxypeptidase family protein n=1 Tax=Robiginitomaculum antarcticum TaxID=437507 RepID=UPI00036F7F37|nr:D-alanyl-D-alanine carboxypeptidase family protein [Robiginitomaculum antarcticum]
MSTFLYRIFFVLIAGALGSGLANAQSSGFETSAPHALIMDGETGIVLYEKDARKPMAPASMTKIMTASLVFDRIRDGSLSLDTEFTVSADAWRRGGISSGSSTMFLEPNTIVSVENLLRGVIIQSGNDACIVLAQGIAGSEDAFARMMTERAQALGLKTAQFRNSTGWPHPEHVMSAYDLAQLARYMINEYPEFYPLYAEREFTWNNHTQRNRNPLLGRFDGADGLKTGATEESGKGLVGSAKQGDTRIIIVVNGLPTVSSRRVESERLMRAGFTEFKAYKLFAPGDEAARANVFMGKSDTVALTVKDPANIGMHKSLRSEMKVRVNYDGPVAAPIAQGQKIGTLTVTVPGQADKTFDLVAANAVERKGLTGRIWSGFGRLFGGS